MTSPRLASQATKTSRADRLLAAELGALAFLLGCYELFDPDIWWHLKSGQWILEHGRVPFLDIFTYSSSNRVWVDLHWGFQVALALAYALAGVAGMILMAAAAGCAAVLIAMTACAPNWPRWVAVLCWLPALALMAMRFDPRPEIFSLVVSRWLPGHPLPRRATSSTGLVPAVLPGLVGQYAWTFHTRSDRPWLFLGRPSGAYLGRPQQFRRRGRARDARPVATPTAGLGGRRDRMSYQSLRRARRSVSAGALPENLRPRQSVQGVRRRVFEPAHGGARSDAGRAGAHPHIRTQIFLLLALPWSFVLPAAWESWRSSVGG